MDLVAIDTAIRAQLSGPHVVLGPDTFGHDPAITSVLQQNFSASAGAVAIGGVTDASYHYDSTAGTITLSGVGTGGPFDSAAVEVSIQVATGVLQLAIKGTPPDGWTLSRSFPDLRSPILQKLAFQQVALSWASYDDGDTGGAGFYFEGNVDFAQPPLSLLQFLFPSATTPQIWGQIQMVGSVSGTVSQTVPQMVLVFDETEDHITVGPFTLYGPQFRIFANPSFNTFSNTWQTDSVVRVFTQLQFKGAWIKVIVEVADAASDVLLELDLAASITTAWDDLVALVGGALDIPHAPVQLTGSLELQDLKFRFDPKAARVTLVGLDIGTDPGQRWQLWSRPASSAQDTGVYLENIKIAFHLTPGASGGYVVDGEISGQVEDWLALQAGIASDGDYTFYGDLIAPKTIKELYQFFTGQQPDDLPDLPDLTVDTFELTVNRGAGQVGYSGELMLSGDWPIPSVPAIALEGVAFKIEQAPAAAVSNITVTARAVLGIDDYSVGVEADYDSSKGWMFSGTVDATAENATLQTLIDKIDKEFQPDATTAPTLPPFLTGWSLKQLATQFTTQEKTFDFTASVRNSAVPWLALDFGVHVSSGATITRTFDGKAQIQSAPFDAAFAVNLTEQTTTTTPASKTSTVTGDYSSQNPPSLDQLLVWLAQTLNLPVNLPAEVDINASAKGFGVQVQQKDQEPQAVAVAGQFALQVDGSDFNVSFAFTNATSFASGGARALDASGQPCYVFGAMLGGLLDLSKLPLVGRIPGVDTLRIDKLGFFYTNATFAAGNTQLFFDVPAVLSPGTLAGDPTAASLTQPGFSLLAVFGDRPNATGTGVVSAGTMPLPVTTGQPSAGTPGFATQPASPTDPIHWLDLHKTLGPVSLQKVGIAYEKPDDTAHQLGRVSLYLDGAFTIAGFAMALDGLGVSVDVPKPSGGISFNPVDDVDFHLGGLFVGYQAPDLEISGGFVTLPGSGINFIGEFSVQAGQFGLQAYGGFSNQDADPSLFLFVHVEAPIGGPPFLFINGLAGGFGVNRSFKLPTFDQLASYPFLPASSVIPGPKELGGDAQSQLATMMKALTNLSEYVPVKAGEYWLAAGLDVNSFEMIDVQAVLSVAFGVEFQVGVVGAATVTVPVNEPLPIAYIQIDFALVFSPSTGLLTAFGSLTPASFVYGGMVHLSGGFAFATWFSGPDSGNFVVTIGGYNPLYKRPAEYPDVPRLQARFGIDALNVTGDAYFALVPHALMAGLSIHATWSLASIDAWFDAAVDFLLNWKPFHYETDAYVHIGVSVTIHVLFVKKRVTVHAGVDLDIWGPPFGGRAVIDLDIVSFKISFGQPQVRETADWAGFRQFLPSVAADPPAYTPNARPAMAAAPAPDTGNAPLVNVTAADGLLKTFKPGESADGLDWLLDPNGFALTTQSAAPCTDAVFNSAPGLKTLAMSQYIDPDALDSGIESALTQHESAPFFAYQPPAGGPAWNTLSFGIPPMNLQGIQSVHAVTIQTVDAQRNVGGLVGDFIVTLQTTNVSSALWGMTGVNSASLQGGNEVIAGALTGFTIAPMIWTPARTTDISYYDLVFDTNDLFLEQDTLPSINTTLFANPDQLYGSMNDGTLFASTAAARAAVVTLLQANGFDAVALVNDSNLNTGQDTGNPQLTYFSSTGETAFAT